METLDLATIVVDSGPSGVAASTALLARGARVTMIDLGADDSRRVAGLRAPLAAGETPAAVRAIKRVTLVPVPWQVAWLGLAVVERLAPGLGLRSDSVISLMSQEEQPVIRTDLLDRIGMTSLDAIVAAHRAGAATSVRRP